MKDKSIFEVKVDGSWISAQVQAIRHGLSEALASKDEAFKKLLKADGLLTRDAKKSWKKKTRKKESEKISILVKTLVFFWQNWLF